MKKSIVTVGFIIVLVLLANWWTGQLIRDQIQEQLPALLGPDNAANLSYEGISVSPLLSQITFSDVQYRATDNQVFQAEVIRSSITYRDFFRLLRENPGNTLNSIGHLSLYIDGSSLVNHGKATEVTMDDGFFTLDGNLGEAVRSAVNRRMPNSPYTLNIDVYDVRDQSLNTSQGFLPGFKEDDDDRTIHVARGSFKYDPVLDQINIEDAELHAPKISMEVEGTGKHTSPRQHFFPSLFQLTYKLTAQPGDTRFTLSPRVGQISMAEVSLESNAVIDLGNLSEFSFENLITDGATRFDLERVRLYPSDHLIQEYGMMSQAFGMDISSLYLNSVNGQYTLNSDRLVVHNTEVATSFFTALLNIDLDLDIDRPNASTINEGSVRIFDMASPIQNFFEDVETLFSTRFEREEDDEILIRFRGPVTAPRIVR